MRAKDIEVGVEYAIGSAKWTKRGKVKRITRGTATYGYTMRREGEEYLGGYRIDPERGSTVLVVYEHAGIGSTPHTTVCTPGQVRCLWADHEEAEAERRLDQRIEREQREAERNATLDRIEQACGPEWRERADNSRNDAFNLATLAEFVEAAAASKVGAS